jgi:hypothetical protein
VAFTLTARVVLDRDETDLIARYKVGEVSVATLRLSDGRGNYFPLPITSDEVVRGWSRTLEDVTELLSIEDQLKEGCQRLKLLLEVMASFGGEETFEVFSDSVKPAMG